MKKNKQKKELNQDIANEQFSNNSSIGNWWEGFKTNFRRIRWSSLSNTWKIFLITLSVLIVFSLIFFGFDSLLGVIFGAIGVI